MVKQIGKLTKLEHKFESLIKFEFTTLTGTRITSSENRWPGSFSTAKDTGYPHTGQKAFNEKALSEQNLPEGQRSTWEIDFGEELEESNKDRSKTFRNIYVMSAKTVQPGEEVTAPQQQPQGQVAQWVLSLDTTGKSIIRQVAFKDVMDKDNKTLAEIMRLTDEYEKILLTTWSPAPGDGEDLLEGEEI